ncbi:MAG TPA: RtcB family protein [Candidatus Hydrogenedens sp.]|nr:RtcB family protein [Candidatus Hydrogenedens sp.]HPP57663.1 RtcB family protein [Candidatus Hydrogenedens sp.]
MKEKELIQTGYTTKSIRELALQSFNKAIKDGMSKKEAKRMLRVIIRNPGTFVNNSLWGELARSVYQSMPEFQQTVISHTKELFSDDFSKPTKAPFKIWGTEIDEESIQQIRNACSLPVSVRGALMPDAHVGYGLPIGGVLATDNAVIPFAVGVDIACRVKLSVFELHPKIIDEEPTRLKKAIEQETRFGVGSTFKPRRQHPVMDLDWNISPVTREHKDKAWDQLGTSGSGNHFVEFGILEVITDELPLAKGKYLALLTHSGSRGTGSLVCEYYSKIARQRHPELPKQFQHLAWLSLDSHTGQEYWEAMQLMGKYAQANHECIHTHISKNLGVPILWSVENHHNFAWKEIHDGREVIVHRKGATPAEQGQLGIIPGSMASPAYIVRGLGNEDSLRSAAHGAGRVMSRAQAKKTLSWKKVESLLKERRITVLTAGVDEIPLVYKNIDKVMEEQSDLVVPVAVFYPRIVKMAPAGEKPED